jgi:uncharacterized protein
MTRPEFVLAVMAAGGEAAPLRPVHAQKLFFLLDREIGPWVGGPHFDFRPYDYGPFDSDVYNEIERLARAGLVEVLGRSRHRSYILTKQGHAEARKHLEALHPNARDYVVRASAWVRSLGFSQLVSAIYQKYPDMKAASVFKQ